jgi:hypothetical protein
MGRPADKIDFDVPGTGTYNDNHQIHYDTLSGSKIGIDQRKSYFIKARGYTNPGPGSYIKQISFPDKKAAPKFGFGTSKRERDYIKESRMQKKFTGPGPGSYEYTNHIGKLPPHAKTASYR